MNVAATLGLVGLLLGASTETNARGSGSNETTSIAASEARPHSVALRIDASSLHEDEREDVARWLDEDARASLAEAGAHVEEPAQHEVEIMVRPADLGYVVSIAVRGPDRDVVLVEREPRTCAACNHTELLAMVDRELMWLGGWLAEYDPPSAAPTPHVPRPTVRVALPAPTVDSTDDARFTRTQRGRWVAGGVITTAGAAFIGTGLWLASHREVLPHGEAEGVPVRSFRDAGVAMVAVGGAAVVTGLGLAISAAVHRRRARRSSRAASMSSPLRYSF
ncbi:MAG: hypothetical protein AAF799_17900 [Myxococcota bacterium]